MADSYEIEPSVQMRLYTLNKRHFALVFLTFFACFATTIIIGVVGPQILESIPGNVTIISSQSSSLTSSGSYVLKSPSLTSFNQQLWLTCRITTDKDDSGKFEWPFTIAVKIVGLMEDQLTEIHYNNNEHNRSRTLQCGNECKDIVILHIGHLSYPNYLITLNIFGLETMKYKVKDIQFLFTTYNASFTQLEIWFRFTFLVFAFLATCMFAHSLRKFSLHNWSIEQKWMTVLLPLLLLFNNPIFPLVFLINSWIPGMFDVIFQTTFISTLMLFWLCLYHGIRQIKRKVATFYLPKLFLVGMIWILVVTLASWQSFKELTDPTYNYQLDSSHFLGVKVSVIVLGSLYLLFLIYLMVRAYSELRSMPYFDLRLKFTTVLLIFVLVVTVTLTVLRFGLDAFDSNFMSNSSSSRLRNSSAEFVAFYGLLNIYLFTMAFVYSPSKNAVYESHFKDNPALSMLNDSEDEVVYGEETSLTSSRMVRPKYDSDEEAFN